jgi:hypothetical protein
MVSGNLASKVGREGERVRIPGRDVRKLVQQYARSQQRSRRFVQLCGVKIKAALGVEIRCPAAIAVGLEEVRSPPHCRKHV